MAMDAPAMRRPFDLSGYKFSEIEARVVAWMSENPIVTFVPPRAHSNVLVHLPPRNLRASAALPGFE